ncbi:recombinase family protein [Bacillus sp. AFS088145]|uniref:recombinase family protein n=1 Tax=Bacillus sp. AFS088145 TaxID=2033514 RepID=UPI000BF505DB|nr:recombinase family protein [Bacillus sp. AFS088145]PFH81622.1 DNA recombinase [Bacillus sp. AFS088145]
MTATTIKTFGYGRVSSKDQNEARQLESFKELGIDDRDTFIDKQSGKDFNRPRYQALKQVLRKGDIVYIHSLDRLGRNKQMILDEWNEITKVIGADIIVLDMPLLDTTKHKDSLGTFISDLVLQILSWIAQDERERINKRQAEGIEAAVKNGVKFGRPKTEFPEGFTEVYARWKKGEITAVKAMNELELKKTTFYKLVDDYQKGKALDQ